MINIGLCDDNLLVLEKYKQVLTTLAQQNNIMINIQTFRNGEQLLFYCSSQLDKLDIIYMDVLMKPLNGIQTVKRLRQLGCNAEVIYLTASEEYVFESFDTAPIHYLLKTNITAQKFEEIFIRAISLIHKKKSSFLTFESGSVIKRVPMDSILYFEIQNRIVSVFYDDKDFRFYSTMNKIEESVHNRGFIRIHRSYVINLKYVVSITKSSIILTSGKILPLGVTYAKLVSNAFSTYLTQVV